MQKASEYSDDEEQDDIKEPSADATENDLAKGSSYSIPEASCDSQLQNY